MRRRARAFLIAALAIAITATGVALAVLMPAGEASDAGRFALSLHPVAGAFKPDGAVLADCGEPRCWEQAFGNVAYRKGPKVALRIFDERIASRPEVEADCHRIAHTIGSASLARYEGNVARAFAEGSSSCSSGYYHGILERALVGLTRRGGLVRVARQICSDEGVRSTWYTAYQCVHGLGHGLMIQTGLDLPASLAVCERLETEWDQTSCDGGVFMENFNTSYGVKSRFLRDDDPIYPCNSVGEQHKLYCYLQVTDRLLALSEYDWKATARRCSSVEAEWRATCFQSYGRNASGVARRDISTLVRLCTIPSEKWRSDCVYGAVREIVNQDPSSARARIFCGAVVEELRPRCFNGAGTILATLFPTARGLRAACAALTKRYLAHCEMR